MSRKDPVYNRGFEDGQQSVLCDPIGWGYFKASEQERYRDGYQAGKQSTFHTRRKEAKLTIISALRIVVQVQKEYKIGSSEVLAGLAKIYLNYNYYHASQQCKQAAAALRGNY